MAKRKCQNCKKKFKAPEDSNSIVETFYCTPCIKEVAKKITQLGFK